MAMILHAEWAGSRYVEFGGFWALFLEGLTGFIAPSYLSFAFLLFLQITIGVASHIRQHINPHFCAI